MRANLRILVGVIVLGGAVATPHNARADDANTAIAKKHYELGDKLYQASAYTEALAEFQKAYRLSPRPALLYNIAKCHESMGQPGKAIEVYKQYLAAKPDASTRSLVEAKIRNLERLRAARQPKPTPTPKPTPAPTPTPAPAPAPTPTPKTTPTPPEVQPPPTEPEPTEPTDHSGSSWKRTTAWIGLSVGGAALVTGVVFGVLAGKKSTEYDDAAADQRPYAELQDIEDKGKRWETLQIATLVAGGVLAAAGGALLVWDLTSDHSESATVSLTPTLAPQGAGLSGTIRF